MANREYGCEEILNTSSLSSSSLLHPTSVVSPISSPLRCPTSADEDTDVDDDIEITRKQQHGDGCSDDHYHPGQEQKQQELLRKQQEEEVLPPNQESGGNSRESKSVLGFSHNLLRKIDESRTLLDTYLKQQRDAIDEVVRRQMEAREREEEEINDKVNELKDLKDKLGLLEDDATSDTNKDDDGDGVSVNSKRQHKEAKGLNHQDAILKEKLQQMEKEMINCRLELEKAERNVKGKRKCNVF